MGEVVLDASAVLALLQDELGSDIVEAALIRGAVLPAPNLAEVITKLCRYAFDPQEILEAIDSLTIRIAPLTEEDAMAAGFLYAETRAAGLSLGDRCCIAVGIRLNARILTADGPWQRANLDAVANIELIR